MAGKPETHTCNCQCSSLKHLLRFVLVSLSVTWMSLITVLLCVVYFQPGICSRFTGSSNQPGVNDCRSPATHGNEPLHQHQMKAGIHKNDGIDALSENQDEDFVVLQRFQRSSCPETRRLKRCHSGTLSKIAHFYLDSSSQNDGNGLIWHTAPWSSGVVDWNSTSTSVVVRRTGFYQLYVQVTLLVNGPAHGFVVEKMNELMHTTRVLRYVETSPLNVPGARRLRTCTAQTTLPLTVGDKLWISLEFPETVRHERDATFWGFRFLGGMRGS